MNIQEIYNLMDRFEGSSMAEMELEMSGAKLVMKKYSGVGAPVMVTSQPQNVGVFAQSAVGTQSIAMAQEIMDGQNIANAQDLAGAQASEATQKNLTPITAPLVGTFYRAASPEDAPFVTVGQQVKKGDVVGIIEAMKLMNEITAPADGIIESIDVENESMVEYNQVLMNLK